MLKELLERGKTQVLWGSPPARLLLDGTQPDAHAAFDALPFVELDSLAAHQRFQQTAAAVLRKRRAIEHMLNSGQEPFSLPGYNALIGQHVGFAVDYAYSSAVEGALRLPNWRERLACPVTGLINRLRGSLLAIDQLLGPRSIADVRIYATEQVTSLFQWLRAKNPGTVGSEFLGDTVALGAERDGLRNEDVTRLTFADGSFDLVITNDVLEHVPGYEKAYAELFRVLAPGGLLVFTVPFNLGAQEHLIRARINSKGELEHLLPPEYHGDPVVQNGGVLCYQIFGWKMMDELRAAGFE
ncbi:MAG TPA: class I SAM-dependent methyltransferase, partial [Myxococcales bacterium]|nr:class I SAM-dependent methyltransferase [Myxococcales bacterium]